MSDTGSTGAIVTLLMQYLQTQSAYLEQISKNEALIAQKLASIDSELAELKMASKMWRVIQWVVVALLAAVLAAFGLKIPLQPP